MSSENNMSNENTQQENQDFKEVRRKKFSSKKEVLSNLQNGNLDIDSAEKLLRARKPPRFVVTKTGAIALYNLQRDPIVLYADQWEKLSSMINKGILENYIKRNENIIKRRPRKSNQEQPVEETNTQ